MNILLIATNQQDRYMNRMVVQPLPLGIAYVASHLDPRRHTLRVLDLMFVDDAHAAVETAIRSAPPDLIGLSLRNLDNQSYVNPYSVLPLVKSLVARMRTLTPATIVCGGPAFSLLPHACFAYLQPDLGLAGDAEETFARLADRLAAGDDYGDLPGLVCRHGDAIVVQESRASASFAKPPRLDLLDIERYRRAGFGIGVITKLSRLYDPAGQGTAEESGAAWRIRPVADVLQEIRPLMHRYGLRRVFFIDSGFNVPLPYGKELCRALGEAQLALRWNTYLRPGPCDEELIALMKRHGCSLALMAGAQPRTGGATLDDQLRDLGNLCKCCEAQALPYTLSLTFGEPGESRATVEHKLAFLEERRPSFATLRLGVRILPGTPVARLALQEGRIHAESQLLHPTFYLEEAVSPWLLERLRAEAERHPRWHLM
jgi:anaerobic magnesium-protoporphyrin IX monomethyl ester cyclase